MKIYIIFGLIFYLAIVLFFIFAHFYKPERNLIKLRGNFIIVSKILIFASITGSGQLKPTKIQSIDLYV